MNGIVTLVLLRSLGMSAVVLALWLLAPILTRFAPARWRYALWICVAAGFLLPPLPSESFFAVKITPPNDSVSTPPPPLPAGAPRKAALEGANRQTTSGSMGNEAPADSAATSVALRSLPRSASPTPPGGKEADGIIGANGSWKTDRYFTLLPYFAPFWLLGLAVVLTLQFIRYQRFLRTVNRWGKPATNPALLALLDKIKAEMAISAPVRPLDLGGAITSPMFFGLVRPTLLLPGKLVSPEGYAAAEKSEKPETSEELALILKHELIHFTRRDLWVRLFVLIASAIHWFNPLLRLVARQIETQGETSCDERVVSGESAVGRRVYAEAILGVVLTQVRGATVLTTSFYGGKQGMKQRIETIFDTRTKPFGSLLFTLGAALVLCGVMALGIAEAELPNDAPTTTNEEPADAVATSVALRTLPRSASSPTPSGEKGAAGSGGAEEKNPLYFGKITDSDGAPLSGVTLTLEAEPLGAGSESLPPQKIMTLASDSDGGWSIPALPDPYAQNRKEFRLRLLVEKDRFVRQDIPLSVDRRKPLNLSLDAGRALAGRVIDPDGQPVPNVRVSIHTSRYQQDDPQFNLDFDHSAWQQLTTDADGRFQSSVYAQGGLSVVLTPENFALAGKSINEYTENTGEIVFTLTEGFRPSVTILDKNGRPVPEMPVRLDRHFEQHIGSMAGSRFAVTDQKGVAVFGPITPGACYLRFEPGRSEGQEPAHPGFRPEIGAFPTTIHGDFSENQPVTIQAVEGVTLTFHAEEPIDLGQKNRFYTLCLVSHEPGQGQGTGLANGQASWSKDNRQVEWIDPQTFRITGVPSDATRLTLHFSPEKENLKYQIRLPGESEFCYSLGEYPSFEIPVEGLNDMTIEMKPQTTVSVKVRVLDAENKPVERFAVTGFYTSQRKKYENDGWNCFEPKTDAQRLDAQSVKNLADAFLFAELGSSYTMMDTNFDAKNFDGALYTQTGLTEGEEITLFAVTEDLRQGSVRIVPGVSDQVTIKLDE